MGFFSSFKKFDAESLSKTEDVNLLLSAFSHIKPEPKMWGTPDAWDVHDEWGEAYHPLLNIIERSLKKVAANSIQAFVQVLRNRKWGVWKHSSKNLADSSPRGWTLVLLGKSGVREAFDPLYAELTDLKSKYRKIAAAALCWLKDPRAFDPFMAALSDPDNDVRKYAILGLGQLRDLRAFNTLLGIFINEQDKARGAAAVALGSLKDPRGVEPLIKTLLKADDDLSSNIVFALGEIGDDRAVEPIIKKYEETKSKREASPSMTSMYQESILKAMGKIGSSSAGDFLIAVSEDPKGEVITALQALAEMSHSQAAEQIILKLKTGQYSSYDQFKLLKAFRGLPERSMPAALLVPFFKDLCLNLKEYQIPKLFHKKGPLYTPRREYSIRAAINNFLMNLMKAQEALPGLINTGDLEGLAALKTGLMRMCADYSPALMMNRLADVCGIDTQREFSDTIEGVALAAELL